jgi:hypothetical protein
MPNKFKILFFLTIIGLNLSAQAPDRFIQFYSPSLNYNAESYGVAETSYGYMLSGISVDTIGSPLGYWAYTVIGVDFMGNQLFEKKYGNENMSFGAGWYNIDWLQKSGNIYYTTDDVLDYTTNKWANMLIVMNELGDTLWTKKYSGDVVDTIISSHSLCKSADGGFILTGETWNSGSTIDKIFILKTDSLGNQEWIKKYNYSTYEGASRCVQDQFTKRIIIVGGRDVSPTISYVYITDSLGNIIHQKYFSGIFGGGLTNLKKMNDGNFVASGYEYTGNTISTWKLMRGFVVKFDINGNLIWKKTLGKESIVNELSGLEIMNGDTIVATGQFDSLYTQGLGLNSMFQVYKISTNGDSISRRYIDIHKDNANQDSFKGLTLTSDGGIAMTGFFPMTSSPTPFVLVKLDKWGCDTVDCQLVGINELNKNDFEFLVYPNPANDNLTISCNNNVSMEYYEIIDVSGKIIAAEKISSTNFSVNMQHIKQGIYALRLFDKNKNASVKRFSVVH